MCETEIFVAAKLYTFLVFGDRRIGLRNLRYRDRPLVLEALPGGYFAGETLIPLDKSLLTFEVILRKYFFPTDRSENQFRNLFGLYIACLKRQSSSLQYS